MEIRTSGLLCEMVKWSLQQHHSLYATQYGGLKVNDLVQISGLGSIHDGKVSVVKDINAISGEHEVSCQEYNSSSGDFVDTVVYCKLEDTVPPEEVELVEKANVEEGGVLKGDEKYGMPNGLNFAWLDPPLPELPESVFPGTTIAAKITSMGNTKRPSMIFWNVRVKQRV